MRYSQDPLENESIKIDNGERTIVSASEVNDFLGGDATDDEAWEMLLDILNKQYPVEDAVRDIREYNAE